MLINIVIAQLLISLFEKFFHLHNPANTLYQEMFTTFYLAKGSNRMEIEVWGLYTCLGGTGQGLFDLLLPTSQSSRLGREAPPHPPQKKKKKRLIYINDNTYIFSFYFSSVLYLWMKSLEME